jgi:glycosyltransferase involved in cell wall biosynthesis
VPTLLSINNYHYRRGGAEVVHLEHMGLFEAFGWQTIPFSMRHPKNNPSPWSDFFVDEIEFGREYSFFEKAARAPRVVYSLHARKRLSALLAENPVDVAHAHNVYHHISPSIFGLLRERGVPVFLTLHDLKLACPAYRMLTHDGVCERCKGGALHQVVLNRCIKGSLALSALVAVESSVQSLLGTYRHNVNRFIVPSQFLRDKLVEWGWPKDRFSYIPNFVDATRFHQSQDPGRRFVYLGRLSHEKGVSTLLRACSRASAPLTIVGSGPEESRLKALASQENVDVEFVGHQPPDRIAAILGQARALVLPSEWYENAPISILEAYACGKPVIGARIGGIPELVRDGTTGALFDSGAVDQLAEALARFSTLSRQTLREMGAVARQWVACDFSPLRYRDRIMEEYAAAGVRACSNSN